MERRIANNLQRVGDITARIVRFVSDENGWSVDATPAAMRGGVSSPENVVASTDPCDRPPPEPAAIVRKDISYGHRSGCVDRRAAQVAHALRPGRIGRPIAQEPQRCPLYVTRMGAAPVAQQFEKFVAAGDFGAEGGETFPGRGTERGGER